MSEKKRPYLYIKPENLQKAFKLLYALVPKWDFANIDMKGTIGKVVKIYAHDPCHLRQVYAVLTANDVECFELAMRHIYVPHSGV